MAAMADPEHDRRGRRGNNGGQPRKAFTADPIDRRVAARLSARRRALGLSPALLDMILGLRDGTVERFEAGESRISASHLYRLAHVFDVKVDWFFTEPESSESRSPGSTSTSRKHDSKRRHAGEAAEARRFLHFFTHLHNPAVRRNVREIVKAIAESDAGSNGGAHKSDAIPADPSETRGTPTAD